MRQLFSSKKFPADAVARRKHGVAHGFVANGRPASRSGAGSSPEMRMKSAAAPRIPATPH
jgi:hypothetical protein